MINASSPQEIYESFLRGEVSQPAAIEAILVALAKQKGSGSKVGLPLRKPEGRPWTEADQERTDAFLAEMDRGMSGTGA